MQGTLTRAILVLCRFATILSAKTKSTQGFVPNAFQPDKLAETYFRFGALWHEGKHQPIDHEQAIVWYRRAVNAGSLPAQTNLGTLLLNRWNRTDEDLEFGVGLLHDAANSGDKKGAWNYALCLDRGIVSDSDPIQAAHVGIISPHRRATPMLLTISEPHWRETTAERYRRASAISIWASLRNGTRWLPRRIVPMRECDSLQKRQASVLRIGPIGDPNCGYRLQTRADRL